MSNLNLAVDMERVQSSVQAAIRPAVEQALAEVDIKALIAKSLTVKEEDPFSVYHRMFGGGRPRPRIEALVDQAVTELAQRYVEEHIREQSGEIKEELRKMMSGSGNKIAKAFARAAEKAIEDRLQFTLKVAVDANVEGDDDE